MTVKAICEVPLRQISEYTGITFPHLYFLVFKMDLLNICVTILCSDWYFRYYAPEKLDHHRCVLINTLVLRPIGITLHNIIKSNDNIEINFFDLLCLPKSLFC